LEEEREVDLEDYLEEALEVTEAMEDMVAMEVMEVTEEDGVVREAGTVANFEDIKVSIKRIEIFLDLKSILVINILYRKRIKIYFLYCFL
jgi:hypothetical protein